MRLHYDHPTRKYTLLFLLFLLSLSRINAQDRDQSKVQEYAEQQEQFKKGQVLREYDSAVYLMDNQQYEVADQKFRYVLSNIKSVPSDLTYHFGRNSYYLRKYKQSIDWLNKYIQLKGTNGQYYKDAVAWKQKAEAEFMKEKVQDSEKIQEVFSKDYDIDCGPSGMVSCPVCKGDHVIIKKGAFGNEYRTCGYCDDHGLLTCAEYNELLRGDLQPKR